MTLLRKNLLKKALRLIPPEKFEYLKFEGQAVNDFGIEIPQYASPISLKGSVQSPENSLYQQMGLDLDKNYKIFYAVQSIKGNEAEPQPDRFIYDNRTYEVVKNSDWFNYDGWCGVLAVELKDLRND